MAMKEKSEDNRRDHRVRVTKMLIRRAFTDLLRQKPLQSISVRELCSKAGINRSTFYAHYSDVYDLLNQIEEEMLAELRVALEPLLRPEAGNPTLAQITNRIFLCLGQNADFCTAILGDYGDKSFTAKLIQMGRERCAQAYAQLFPNATAKQIDFFYTFVSEGCIGLLRRWMEEGMVTGAEELATMAENIMVYGMGWLRRQKPAVNREDEIIVPFASAAHRD